MFTGKGVITTTSQMRQKHERKSSRKKLETVYVWFPTLGINIMKVNETFFYWSLLLLRPFIIHSLLITNERYLKLILQLKVVILFPFTSFISFFRTTKICGVSWRSSGRQVSSTSSSPSVGSSPLQCCWVYVTSSRKGSVEWSSSSQHQ